MKVRCRWGAVLFFLFIGFMVPNLLGASGVQEERLSQAKNLIEQKRYNEARALLVEIQREDPERQEQVQELLNICLQVDVAYNQKYAEVVDALLAKDPNKALSLIEAMKMENPNLPRAQVVEIRKAEKSARFIVSKNEFDQIMLQGLTAIKAQEYGKALSIYSSGLSGNRLHRSEFDENNYGETIKALTLNALKDILTSVDEFQKNEKAFADLQLEGTRILGANPQDIFGKMQPLWERMEQLASLRVKIEENSLIFKEQSSTILKNFPDLAPDYFLDYAWNLVRGREKSNEIEGVSGALENLWNKIQISWESQINERLTQLLAAAEGFYSRKAYADAQKTYEEASLVAQAGTRTLGLWNRILNWQGDFAWNDGSQKIIQAKVPQFLDFFQKSQIADGGARAARVQQNLAAVQQRSLQGTPAGDLIISDRRLVTLDRQNWEGLLTRLTGFQDLDNIWGKYPVPVKNNNPMWNLYRNTWSQGQQDSFSMEISLVEKIGKIEYQPLESSYQSLEANFLQAEKVFQGQSSDIPGQISRSPQDSLRLLTQGLTEQGRLSGALEVFLRKYRGEDPLILRETRIQNIISQAQRTLDFVNALRARMADLQTQAETVLAEARKLRQEGEAAVQQLQDFLTRDETVPRARESLKLYQDRIPRSLALQDDRAYRSQYESNSVNWDQAIYVREVEVMTLDVQKSLALVKSSFGLGRYNQASQDLNRALVRWNQTIRDGITNPEITLWQDLIAQALNVSGDREVLITDPLYDVIRQLLNYANRDYDQGLEAKKQGKDSNVLFFRSQSYIAQVKTVYPLNQEANVLLLKILFASNPDQAQTLLKEKVEDARKLLNEGNYTLALPQLEDLSKISPNFQGLDADIRRAKIGLGLIKVVDPAALARSDALTQQAAALARNNTPQSIREAQGLLATALTLNPNNFQASFLAGTLTTQLAKLGGPAALTPAEEQIFQTAENYYNAGDSLNARIAIRQLWSLEKNRNIIKVQRLYVRISSM